MQPSYKIYLRYVGEEVAATLSLPSPLSPIQPLRISLLNKGERLVKTRILSDQDSNQRII